MVQRDSETAEQLGRTTKEGFMYNGQPIVINIILGIILGSSPIETPTVSSLF
jgi:uncharacterized transporter YbjL